MLSRAARVDIAMSVRLRFREGDAVPATSVNLSETGMLVLAEDARPVGTHLRFQFPDFQGIGKVVWARESEPGVHFLELMGIEFFPLDRSARKVLEGLLKASV